MILFFFGITCVLAALPSHQSPDGLGSGILHRGAAGRTKASPIRCSWLRASPAVPPAPLLLRLPALHTHTHFYTLARASVVREEVPPHPSQTLAFSSPGYSPRGETLAQTGDRMRQATAALLPPIVTEILATAPLRQASQARRGQPRSSQDATRRAPQPAPRISFF